MEKSGLRFWTTANITPESSHLALPTYDKALTTRRNCVIGICFSAILAVLCLGAAGAVLSHQTSYSKGNVVHAGTVSIDVPLIAARVLPLLFNICISACTEALGYAHATTLRWALIQEGRLEFNSNLRLFTACRKTWVNGKFVNFVSGALLVVCYTASGQMFPGLRDSGSGSTRVIVNGIALLMLGIGLLGLCIITIACLTTGNRYILTWSPNPLVTTLACIHHGTLVHRPGRGMMPVHSASLPSQAAVALPKQPPVRNAYSATRTTTKFLWFIFALNCVFGALICGLTYKFNRAPSLNFFGANDSTVFLIIGGPSWPADALLLCGFLFGFVLQAFITLALHCMELVVNVSRDEASWRSATTAQGASLSSSGLGGAIHSWQWLTLFTLKPLASWLFGGVGITYRVAGTVLMEFNAEPLFVLAGVALLLVLLGEKLVRSQPQGPQPAAFGHLQTLANLVDDWGAGTEGHLFWGAKRNLGEGGFAMVGTSSARGNVEGVVVSNVYS